MTKDMIKLTTLTGAILAVPALAFAQLSLGDPLGTDEAAIRAALTAQGAEVLEIEFEDGEIEVDYLLDGTEYEAEIDPATGAVISVEAEMDEEDDDDDEDDDDGEDDAAGDKG